MNRISVVCTGWILLFVQLDNSGLVTAHSARTRSQQEQYFRRYGYLQGAQPNATQLASLRSDSSDGFTAAIRKFQRMTGVRVTGTMTAETIRMMEMPRCGVPDVQDHVQSRQKRYAIQGSKWPRFRLSYKIQNFTNDMPRPKIENEIAKAFQFWGNVSALSFVRHLTATANIDIKFASGRHGDGNDFDGLGGTLAHAFFPNYGGDIHFDDDEWWTSESRYGTNLLQVAIHEIGHSLGLHHSEEPHSIMAPVYKGFKSNTALHADDIAAIRFLYGRR